jgi:hypothetical protein
MSYLGASVAELVAALSGPGSLTAWSGSAGINGAVRFLKLDNAGHGQNRSP